MKDVIGKVAVVTDRDNGIDSRMVEAFAAACTRVVLSEIEHAVLESTASAFHAMSSLHGTPDDWAWLIGVAHGIHLFLPDQPVKC